jgi:hypothetical protein
MPFHRIPRARLHEDITAIEREGEIIVTVLPHADDPDHVDVYTRWRGDVETSVVGITSRARRRP